MEKSKYCLEDELVLDDYAKESLRQARENHRQYFEISDIIKDKNDRGKRDKETER